MYTSAEVCKLAGISYRQLRYWIKCGYLPDARFLNKGDGTLHEPRPDDHYGRTGYNLVLNERGMAVAVALGAVSRIGGTGTPCIKQVAAALNSLALVDFPRHSVVLNSEGASIDGPIGMAALVVDLGACVVGDAGLAAVV